MKEGYSVLCKSGFLGALTEPWMQKWVVKKNAPSANVPANKNFAYRLKVETFDPCNAIIREDLMVGFPCGDLEFPFLA